MMTPQPWSAAYSYIQLFFKIAHPYMTLDVERDPPKSAYQEILEEEKTMSGHVVDFLHICKCIMAIGREGINRGEIGGGSPGMDIA